ncbi:hypothetical protein E4H12_12840 [Candidatus Thorarchaeota archaeon]|nr:MAG: hypothetical protein E4H12_12840 [Candidatus Thorarchaeota archaeon]
MTEADVKPLSTGNPALDEEMPPSAWFNLACRKTVSYFEQDWPDIVQPCKSYAVALVYARLLERYFNEDFITVLSDPELLFKDKHFVPYSANSALYDQLISMMTYRELWDFESNPISQVQTTVRYFKKEFLLE